MKIAGAILVLVLFLSMLAYLFYLIDPFDRRGAEFTVAVFLKTSCRENSPKNSQAALSYLREHKMEATINNLEIANLDPTFRQRLRPVPAIGETKLVPPGTPGFSRMVFDPCRVLR
jgi:hypothetical protein